MSAEHEARSAREELLMVCARGALEHLEVLGGGKHWWSNLGAKLRANRHAEAYADRAMLTLAEMTQETRRVQCGERGVPAAAKADGGCASDAAPVSRRTQETA